MGCGPSTANNQTADYNNNSRSMTQLEEHEYQQKTAQEKMDFLWSKVTEDKTAIGWQGALPKQVAMLTGDLNDNFTHKGDEIPSATKPGEEARCKVIHLQGAVAKLEWRSFNNHPYTGVYAGSKNIISRFSLGAPADVGSGWMLGGFAMKNVLTGSPSTHMVAMHSIAGMPLNFLAVDHSNHIAATTPENVPPLSSLVVKKFSSLPVLSAFKMGSGNLATHDVETGKRIAKDEVKFPFRVCFHPPPEVRKMFEDDGPYPRQEGDDNFVVNQLMQVPEGTVLFKVYAEHTPDTPLDEVPIGEIILRSPFTTSQFGDKKLYFRHATLEEDYLYYPEWEEQINAIEAREKETVPIYRYPMAPDVEDPASSIPPHEDAVVPFVADDEKNENNGDDTTKKQNDDELAVGPTTD